MPATDTPIVLTIAEIGRLLNVFLAAPRDIEFAPGWWLWRRSVQARPDDRTTGAGTYPPRVATVTAGGNR
ncbi:hypothetical protein Aab01nite_51810 [Paractinoplanes abujensis]|nr:hypothetical protein Aab01nite_51810 [Actinoplanes abujensis]